MAKRRSSTYQPGRRSPDWRKLKLKHRQELVIAGWTRGKGRRSNGIGSLILGVHGPTGFAYAGNVGTGLTDGELDRLEALLAPLVRPGVTVRRRAAGATGSERRGDLGRADARRRDRVRRVDKGHPQLCAPVYLGLRDDKPAADVVAERIPMEAELTRGTRTLKLTNLDKRSGRTRGSTRATSRGYLESRTAACCTGCGTGRSRWSAGRTASAR